MKRNENTRKCLFFYSCTSKEREIVNFFILSTLFQSVVNLLRAFPNSHDSFTLSVALSSAYFTSSIPNDAAVGSSPRDLFFHDGSKVFFIFFPLFSCIYSTHIHTLEEKREEAGDVDSESEID